MVPSTDERFNVLQNVIIDLMAAAVENAARIGRMEGESANEAKTVSAAKFERIARNALTNLANPDLTDALVANIATVASVPSS
jgi:hypothetical protein